MRESLARANQWARLLARACSPADRFLLLRVLLFAAAVPLLMRMKLPRLQDLLEPKADAPSVPPASVERIIHFVDSIVDLGAPLTRRRCLTRGVTLYYFLRRAGLDVALDFGMGNVGGEFLGHCWLVKDDEPFLEGADPRALYAPMYRIPRRGGDPGPAGSLGGAWRAGA
jgi:hypothetical protein